LDYGFVTFFFFLISEEAWEWFCSYTAKLDEKKGIFLIVTAFTVMHAALIGCIDCMDFFSLFLFFKKNKNINFTSL